MPLRAKWTRVAVANSTKGVQLARSSHCISVHNDKAVIAFGEHQPRDPVDSNLVTIDLHTGKLNVDSNERTPSKRVGAAWTRAPQGSDLFMWGGRGGKDMATFSEETKGDKPEPRSFHVMTTSSDGNTLFVHAGCPAKGRLSTLHSLSLATLEWSERQSAPEPGRGGTNLTWLPNSNLLARFGGFAGRELDGFDLYDTELDEWRSIETRSLLPDSSMPGKRSVTCLVPVDGNLRVNQDDNDNKRIVAVMAHGERDPAPAELGHDGSGFFHQDVWALVAENDNDSRYTLKSQWSWLKLEPTQDSEKDQPEARGWFASSFYKDNKILMHGGLNANNERLDDAWILEIVRE
ncbi:hypothetical protein OIO90_002217 [Microbotryomycetes sp. JL221]|nr:hypothetical protein OIO90_002217 [Microbotryomycetes sp. JL221]